MLLWLILININNTAAYFFRILPTQYLSYGFFPFTRDYLGISTERANLTWSLHIFIWYWQDDILFIFYFILFLFLSFSISYPHIICHLHNVCVHKDTACVLNACTEKVPICILATVSHRKPLYDSSIFLAHVFSVLSLRRVGISLEWSAGEHKIILLTPFITHNYYSKIGTFGVLIEHPHSVRFPRLISQLISQCYSSAQPTALSLCTCRNTYFSYPLTPPAATQMQGSPALTASASVASGLSL